MIFSWSSFLVGFICGAFGIGFFITSAVIIYSYIHYQNMQKANSEVAKKIQDDILGAARAAFRQKGNA